jgi:hypothetical protein
MAHHIVTAQEMLSAGVTLLLEEKTVNRRCVNSHLKTFLDHFGVRASTACSIYEDLQVKVGVVHNNESIKWFLISLYYLKNYPKEHQLESTFNINEKYGSKKCWQWIKDVQALQHVKVVMPADWGDDIFAATLDGTDSWTNERQHWELNRDPQRFSQKFGHAGLAYLLVIALTGGLIGLYGPFKAGKNDITKFRDCPFIDVLRSNDLRAIGDLGFRGEENLISVPNAHDSPAVTDFKSRALKRHESFNKLIKDFEITLQRFRHSDECFGSAFEAVSVICQYKIEEEVPLFDVLIQSVRDKEE